MLLVCLDTSFIVDLLRRKPAAEKRLQSYLNHEERLTTTPITAAELFEGAYSLKEKRTEVVKVRELLEHLELLDLSFAVSERYGKLVNELRARGQTTGTWTPHRQCRTSPRPDPSDP